MDKKIIFILFSLSLSFFLLGYLVGSILFGTIIASYKNVNLRKLGSKNVGATNVLRNLGKKWGLVVFILDFWKPLFSIFISLLIFHWSKNLFENEIYKKYGFIIYFSGIGATIGHCFPILWILNLIFRRKKIDDLNIYAGGKGAACMAGLFTAISPILFAVGVSIFFLILFISRYVSLASVLSIWILTILVIIPEMNMYYMPYVNEQIKIFDKLIYFKDYKDLSISFSNNQSYLFVMFSTSFIGSMIITYKHKVNLTNIYYQNERKANFIWNKKK